MDRRATSGVPRRVGTALILAYAASAAGCTSTSPFVPDATGQWGGLGIDLVVTAERTQLELDCAHAELASLTVDETGSFSEPADLVMEGGPEREDQPRETRPVVVDGAVVGDRMSATIRFVADGTVAGPYQLTRGEQGLLRKCL